MFQAEEFQTLLIDEHANEPARFLAHHGLQSIQGRRSFNHPFLDELVQLLLDDRLLDHEMVDNNGQGKIQHPVVENINPPEVLDLDNGVDNVILVGEVEVENLGLNPNQIDIEDAIENENLNMGGVQGVQVDDQNQENLIQFDVENKILMEKGLILGDQGLPNDDVGNVVAVQNEILEENEIRNREIEMGDEGLVIIAQEQNKVDEGICLKEEFSRAIFDERIGLEFGQEGEKFKDLDKSKAVVESDTSLGGIENQEQQQIDEGNRRVFADPNLAQVEYFENSEFEEMEVSGQNPNVDFQLVDLMQVWKRFDALKHPGEEENKSNGNRKRGRSEDGFEAEGASSGGKDDSKKVKSYKDGNSQV